MPERASSVSGGGPGWSRESRSANVVGRDGGPSGRRKGPDVPMKPGNAGGGKGPYFWCVCEGGKDRRVAMSLATPDKIRDLQVKLHRKAKKEPEFRFHQLYDKVYREDILIHAYRLAKSNDGAPGVGEVSFEDIESGGPQGVMEWLNGLGTELHDKTYKPQPVQPVGDRVFLYTQKTGVPVSVKL